MPRPSGRGNLLISYLKEVDYRIDVDSGKAHQSFDTFLNDLDETLKNRIEIYQYLWEKEPWQIFMLVFTETDHLMHFLWDAYEDGSHKYHSRFLEYFRKIDEIIGEIAGKSKDSDSIILLSDHGFEKLEKDVNINSFLKNEGFLKLIPGEDERFSSVDYDTRAFALDPARIYINLKGKYPRGTVELKDKERIVKDLETLFISLESEGKRVIKRVFGKEEIYEGHLLEQAPDLVLVGGKGFNLKATMKTNELFSKGIFTGKHTQEDAFFLLKDRIHNNIIPKEISVFDIFDIIRKLTIEKVKNNG